MRSRPSGLAGAFATFRHPGYGEYFVAQFVSNIGNHVQVVAQAWLIYRLTGSPELLGLVAFVNQLPFLLLGPVAGAVADRFDRRRIMLVTHGCAIVLALGLAWATAAQAAGPALIVAIAAAAGVVNAVDIPTRQALLREIVGLEDLSRAVALNLSMLNAARMVGPAVGSVLILAIGEAGCFLVNAVSYAAVVICLLRLRPQSPAQTGAPPPFWLSILEAFAFVRGSPQIIAVLLIGAAAGLLAAPYASLLPVFAGEILEGGPAALGLLMSASGVGALLGAAGLAVMRSRWSPGLWIVGSTAAFGACVALFGASRLFWLSMALMLATGVAQVIQMTTGTISVQSRAPDHLRGRVLALFGMMQQGVPPFGALIAGLAAGRFGASPTLIFGGALCFIIGLASLKVRHRFS